MDRKRGLQNKAVYFVLVYNTKKLSQANHEKLTTFIKNLIVIGLEVEVVSFIADDEIKFINIHASDNFVDLHARLCNVNLACRSIYYRPPPGLTPNYMATPLTRPDPNDSVYQRSPEAVSGVIPTTILSAEKILVIVKILKFTKYGEKLGDYSYRNLLEKNILIDAFPLHDGDYMWTEEGDLNDRQLLMRFWGNFNCLYKAQPLNLIERYYGTQVAFYFAWFGHYVKMLIPVGILSVLCVLYGMITAPTKVNTLSLEICNSDVKICPLCHYASCELMPLNGFCFRSYFTYILDNPATMTLAILTTFWSTLFVELWKRTEAELNIRWNTMPKRCHDERLRPQYVEKCKEKRISPISRKPVPYYKTSLQMFRYTTSSICLLILIFIIFIAMGSVVLFRVNYIFFVLRHSTVESDHYYTKLTGNITSAIALAILIVLIRMTLKKFSFWLTQLENHRTQYIFDLSFVLKSYVLDFVNSYSIFFYTAFFRESFFTTPGEITHWTKYGGIEADLCGPTGCTYELGIQLFFIFLVKAIFYNIAQIVEPLLQRIRREKSWKIRKRRLQLKYYEQEYLLAPVDRYFIDNEMADLVIQYGYVIFFVVAFPPAAALALFSNIIELRVDASKMIKSYRRPVAKRTCGLGIWVEIIQYITYLGVITNGIVSAFTSDFVPRYVFRSSTKSSLGYIGSTLSAFAVSEFTILRTNESTDVCYYPGRRYPPDHSHRYELTWDYWMLISIRFIVLLIFEHLIFLINGILAYAIPDIPATVAEKLEAEQVKNKKKRLNQLEQDYKKKIAT